MNAIKPHFLLFSESNRKQPQGHWRFVLQSLDGSEQFEAADEEPNVHGERLELLAVVRGLEAVPEPARVTLVTPSKYVNRGLTQGLPAWRSSDWQWEHFGDMVPVKNRDLWQRIDRAMGFHQVECRTWRFDLPHTRAVETQSVAPASEPANNPPPGAHRQRRVRRFSLLCKRLAARSAENWQLAFGRLGTRLVPLPWFE